MDTHDEFLVHIKCMIHWFLVWTAISIFLFFLSVSLGLLHTPLSLICFPFEKCAYLLKTTKAYLCSYLKIDTVFIKSILSDRYYAKCRRYKYKNTRKSLSSRNLHSGRMQGSYIEVGLHFGAGDGGDVMAGIDITW